MRTRCMRSAAQPHCNCDMWTAVRLARADGATAGATLAAHFLTGILLHRDVVFLSMHVIVVQLVAQSSVRVVGGLVALTDE